jgi:hypothetical protein
MFFAMSPKPTLEVWESLLAFVALFGWFNCIGKLAAKRCMADAASFFCSAAFV